MTDVQAALHELLAAIPVLPAQHRALNDAARRQVVAAILAGDAGPRPGRSMEEHCDATSALLRGLLG